MSSDANKRSKRGWQNGGKTCLHAAMAEASRAHSRRGRLHTLRQWPLRVDGTSRRSALAGKALAPDVCAILMQRGFCLVPDPPRLPYL